MIFEVKPPPNLQEGQRTFYACLDGVYYIVALPEGFCDGDTIRVEVRSSDHQQLPPYVVVPRRYVADDMTLARWGHPRVDGCYTLFLTMIGIILFILLTLGYGGLHWAEMSIASGCAQNPSNGLDVTRLYVNMFKGIGSSALCENTGTLHTHLLTSTIATY